MSDLTQEEANKLFSEVSEAMQKEDSSKLSSLLAQESPEEQEPPESDTPADEPEHTEVDTTEVESHDEVEDDKPAAVVAGDKKKDDEDPIATLRAEIEELRKTQHTLSSQAGRVSSLQRRLAQYDKQLADLSKSTSSQTVEKVKPKVDEALKDLDITDPALAQTLRAVMEQALSGVAGETTTKEIERIRSLRDEEYSLYQEEQTTALLSKYPNAKEVFSSPHWAEWKRSQPKHILDLAGSDSAEAVSMALELYRSDMIRQHPELAKGRDTANAPEPPVNERAQQIEEERKRKQQNSANLDSGKPPVRSKDPADAEALFKKFSEDIRKEITGK